MIRQYFIPESIWPQVVAIDAAENVAVQPSQVGQYRAIAGVLADGVLTISSSSGPNDFDLTAYTPITPSNFDLEQV